MLLTAREAAERLGVKLDTLYAYVSRRRLRSVMVPGTRERRYRVEDIETMLAARLGARPTQDPAPEALMPVIGSSICLIENGRFYYRGRDAIRLSDSATLEEISRLLWLDEARFDWASTNWPVKAAGAMPGARLIERCQLRLAALGDEDLPELDLARTRVIRTAWRILHELVGCVAPRLTSREPIHRQLAVAWQVNKVRGHQGRVPRHPARSWSHARGLQCHTRERNERLGIRRFRANGADKETDCAGLRLALLLDFLAAQLARYPDQSSYRRR